MKDDILKLSPLANRIKQLRLDRGIGQIELSKMTGINQSTINRYEQGLKRMQCDHAALIADVLHTSIDYMLGRTIVDQYDPAILADYSLDTQTNDHLASLLDVIRGGAPEGDVVVSKIINDPVALEKFLKVLRRSEPAGGEPADDDTTSEPSTDDE